MAEQWIWECSADVCKARLHSWRLRVWYGENQVTPCGTCINDDDLVLWFEKSGLRELRGDRTHDKRNKLVAILFSACAEKGKEKILWLL